MAHSHWSAENATKAYLRTITMGKSGKEPTAVEFISALAGGNNARLMLEVCGSIAGSITRALVAAAQQTRGHVVCIVPTQKELEASKSDLSRYLDRIEFVVGDPLVLLTSDYMGADFVVVDCNIDDHKSIIKAAKTGGSHEALVVGCNVPSWDELDGHFLPIGEGLVVVSKEAKSGGGLSGKNSKWIVKVDKCTGEEHVFRVTSPKHKVIQA